MNAESSIKRRLADALLEDGLDAYVRDRRMQGKSWRRISIELRDDVDVDVEPQTLSTWYRDRGWHPPHKAASASRRSGLGRRLGRQSQKTAGEEPVPVGVQLPLP